VIRTLLILTLVLILAVGAQPAPRIETRYTFFLYPLLVALSLGGLIAAIESWLGSVPVTLAVGVTLGLLLFGLSEDFQPAHVARIDSRTINFRIGMNPLVADQYFLRAQYRLGARWLSEHEHPGELVLTSIPTIDQYYHRANFFFCRRGILVGRSTPAASRRWTVGPICPCCTAPMRSLLKWLRDSASCW